MKKNKTEMTLQEFRSLGGKACLKKYGKEYYRDLVKKRWNKREKIDSIEKNVS